MISTDRDHLTIPALEFKVELWVSDFVTKLNRMILKNLKSITCGNASLFIVNEDID